MLKLTSPDAKYCYERALEARERFLKSTDRAIRDEFLASEARWLKLAQSYEFSDRLSRFLDTPTTLPNHPECANCHVPMWLVKVESDREANEYHYECKGCEAKATLRKKEQPRT